MWISENAEPEIPIHIPINLRIRSIFPPNQGICNNKRLKSNAHAWHIDVLCIRLCGLTVLYTRFVHLRNNMFPRTRAEVASDREMPL